MYFISEAISQSIAKGKQSAERKQTADVIKNSNFLNLTTLHCISGAISQSLSTSHLSSTTLRQFVYASSVCWASQLWGLISQPVFKMPTRDPRFVFVISDSCSQIWAQFVCRSSFRPIWDFEPAGTSQFLTIAIRRLNHYLQAIWDTRPHLAWRHSQSRAELFMLQHSRWRP